MNLIPVIILVALFHANEMKFALLICCKRTEWQGGIALPSIPFNPDKGFLLVGLNVLRNIK